MPNFRPRRCNSFDLKRFKVVAPRFRMEEIKGIARVKFLPGKVEEWKRLTEQAMEIVRI